MKATTVVIFLFASLSLLCGTTASSASSKTLKPYVHDLETSETLGCVIKSIFGCSGCGKSFVSSFMPSWFSLLSGVRCSVCSLLTLVFTLFYQMTGMTTGTIGGTVGVSANVNTKSGKDVTPGIINTGTIGTGS